MSLFTIFGSKRGGKKLSCGGFSYKPRRAEADTIYQRCINRDFTGSVKLIYGGRSGALKAHHHEANFLKKM